MLIIKQALLGIIEMHERGIVHAMIIPRNIFVKNISDDIECCNNIKVALGNFELSGTPESAKCSRTARNYRFEPYVNDYSHDMYSFGVVMLQFLGNIMLNTNFKNDEQVKQVVGEVIIDVDNNNLKEVIIKLLSSDPSKKAYCTKINVTS